MNQSLYFIRGHVSEWFSNVRNFFPVFCFNGISVLRLFCCRYMGQNEGRKPMHPGLFVFVDSNFLFKNC